MDNSSSLPDYIKDPTITGSHEEFWVFSRNSQWDKKFLFSEQNIFDRVREAIMEVKNIGMKHRCSPRVIHTAQLFLWRFYAKMKISDYPPVINIPIAFECASQILEIEIPNECKRLNDEKSNEFDRHFELVSAINFNTRVHHPSEYLTQYTNNQGIIDRAEGIISDSFLIPACLFYKPVVIAEGAAVMASAMSGNMFTHQSLSVAPKSKQCLPFIQDMREFYQRMIR
jgi:cyclin C